MPELPEVETVRRGLAPVMEHARITTATVNRPDLRWPFPDRMADRLTGRRVERVRRRSKYLLVDLDQSETLLVHLGMSGRMLVSGDPLGMFHRDHPPRQKHDHVVLDFDSGARVTFNDPRRFGAMDMFETDGAHWLLDKLGPEPLGNEFTGPGLETALHARRSPIKTMLLDQRIVAGLGNIYVCEALYRAGIHPKRPAGRISAARVHALVPIIQDVLTDAIDAGGSSLRDYRQADGELGYFQHRFAVYDREDGPCPKDDCDGVIQRIVQSGRSSFFCPRCQR